MVCAAAFSSQKHTLSSTSLTVSTLPKLLTDFLPICNLLIKSPDESLVVIKTEKRRRGGLLIDQLTCGLQMTGSGARHEECLCYFPSREEMNFLWFFRNAARGRRRRRFQARDRNRQESQLMRLNTFIFWVLMRSAGRSEPVSKRLSADGLALKRVFGDGASFSVRRFVFDPSKNVLCRHLMSLLESDEVPSACFEDTTFRDRFDLWCLLPNLELMYVGGKEVLQVVSSKWKVCSFAKQQQLLIDWLRNILSCQLLFLYTPFFNWCWDPSIVKGAGWGCSRRNYKDLPW